MSKRRYSELETVTQDNCEIETEDAVSDENDPKRRSIQRPFDSLAIPPPRDSASTSDTSINISAESTAIVNLHNDHTDAAIDPSFDGSIGYDMPSSSIFLHQIHAARSSSPIQVANIFPNPIYQQIYEGALPSNAFLPYSPYYNVQVVQNITGSDGGALSPSDVQSNLSFTVDTLKNTYQGSYQVSLSNAEGPVNSFLVDPLASNPSNIQRDESSRLDNDTWNIMIQQLLDYQTQYGHTKVPRTYSNVDEHDKIVYKLGEWLYYQQIAYSFGKLREDRLQQFQGLIDTGKFVWDTNISQSDLAASFDHDISYPMRISSGNSESFDRDCGDFIVSLHEHNHHAMADPSLPQDNAIFEANHEDNHRNMNVHEKKWEIMFSYLQQFIQKYGHARVPHAFKLHDPTAKKDINLGLWLRTQRQLYNKGAIRKDRISKLQALIDKGYLVWSESKEEKGDARWQQHYEALLEYGAKYGHYNIKERDSVQLPDGGTLMLGRWLDRLRSQYSKGTLPKDRNDKFAALVATGKLTESIAQDDDKRWLFYLDILKKWGEKNNGDCNAPRNATYTLNDGTVIPIGKWIGKQRALRKHKPYHMPLREDRAALLEELVQAGKLKWSLVTDYDENWDLHYSCLINARGNGDCNFSRSEKIVGPNNQVLKIGSWLAKQVEKYRMGKLSEDKRQKFNELIQTGRLSLDRMQAQAAEAQEREAKGFVHMPHLFNAYVGTNEAVSLHHEGSNMMLERMHQSTSDLSHDMFLPGEDCHDETSSDPSDGE